MKLHKYIIIVMAILFVATGCKKKTYPQSVSAEENPFYLKLLFDGKPVDINAGKDNYYMYSYITRDSSKIYSLVGEFKQNNCSVCPNSMRVQIVDTKTTTANVAMDVNSLLKITSYRFVRGNQDTVFSKVIIQFTDANGVTYTSNHGEQSVNSVLNVLSVEDYVSDQYSTPIKKVKLSVNCKLFNGNTFKQLESSEIVVGLVN